MLGEWIRDVIHVGLWMVEMGKEAVDGGGVGLWAVLRGDGE